ncbi:hypothetical protein BH24GEM3_BH24GEM3_23370 [soil metagenome]|jgi:hypothetical protein|nr:hypothetical protein [Gemmatimonadota bacterium]
MQQSEPQVTTQRGYQLPEAREVERRERGNVVRAGPYERSYELRRGYERPPASARPHASPAE